MFKYSQKRRKKKERKRIITLIYKFKQIQILYFFHEGKKKKGNCQEHICLSFTRELHIPLLPKASTFFNPEEAGSANQCPALYKYWSSCHQFFFFLECFYSCLFKTRSKRNTTLFESCNNTLYLQMTSQSMPENIDFIINIICVCGFFFKELFSLKVCSHLAGSVWINCNCSVSLVHLNKCERCNLNPGSHQTTFGAVRMKYECNIAQRHLNKPKFY